MLKHILLAALLGVTAAKEYVSVLAYEKIETPIDEEYFKFGYEFEADL